MVGAARKEEEEEVAPPLPTSIAAACAASFLPRRILFHPPLRAPPPSSSSSLTPLNLAPSPDQQASLQHSNGDRSCSATLNSCSSPFRTSHTLPSALVKRIGAGLNNLGNTCFLNSVLQCLTYTPPLAIYFQEGLHKSSCRAVAFCAMCALENHVKQALSAPGRVTSPNQLVKNLRCISRSFQMGRQEDAHEYMRYLIEALQKCCPLDVHAKASPSSQKNYIQKIFGGQLQSQVKCTECAHSSNTYDPFLDLSLDIVKAESLLKALTRFTGIEVLDGDNKYFCSKCKKKVRAHKQFTIDHAPHVLTVQFKRFSSSGGFGGKIDKKVHFDRTLDLTPFVNSKEGGIQYSLYAVLVHAGWSTHSGHYFCFVRTFSDIWHRLDDCRVSQVSEKSVLEQKAYILFYIRDSKIAPTANGNHCEGVSEKSNMLHATSGMTKVEANGANVHGAVIQADSNRGESTGKDAVRVHMNGLFTANITDQSSNGAKRVEVLGNGRPMKAEISVMLPKTCRSAQAGETGREHRPMQVNGVLVNGHIDRSKDTLQTNKDYSGSLIFSPEAHIANGCIVPEVSNGNKKAVVGGGCTFSKEEHAKEHSLKKLERQEAQASCSEDISAPGSLSNSKVSSCGKRVVSLPLSNAALLPVPRWEDGEHNTLKQMSGLGEVAHCGHVLDEWDEEYDRGKRKKVKSRLPLQQELLDASEHVHKKRKEQEQEHSGASSSNGVHDNLFQALAGKKVDGGVNTPLLKKRRKRERVREHKLFLKRDRFKQLRRNRRHRRKR